MEKFKNALTSRKWMPIILLIGFTGWVCNIDFITVPFICIYVGLLLAFCDDATNIFTAVFSVPFFANKIQAFVDYVILGIGVLFFIIGLTIFLIRQLHIKKVQVKKGELFWPSVITLIAYLLGGIIGNFNILTSVIIFAMTAATYFLYWLAINFTSNLKEFIRNLFIAIGIVLTAQLIVSYAKLRGPFFSSILYKNVIWIGLQNINVASLYFTLAMIATFSLAVKHKYDYLLTLAGMFFALCNYFCYSRSGTLLCFILLLTCIIYTIIKSKNKQVFFISLSIIFATLTILCIIFFDQVSRLVMYYLQMGFYLNGRSELWTWCFTHFKEFPIFGIGYKSSSPVPGITAISYVIAHNTLLQHITSLGMVGTVLMIYYYVRKYQIVCTKFNGFKFLNLLSILAIGLSGITDQAPTMDIFVICIATIFIALAENDTNEQLLNDTKNTTLSNDSVRLAKSEELSSDTLTNDPAKGKTKPQNKTKRKKSS